MTGNADPAAPETVVRDFVAAWNRIDMAAVLDFLTEDVFYHNIPMAPLEGRAAVAAFIDGMGPVRDVDWEIHHIAARGNVVLTERTDRLTIGDKRIELPVMGTFEIRDGRIAAWRDYFDLATFTRALE